MNVAGLFSGIGGLELPFRNRGATTELLCDAWDMSQRVLRTQFPGIPVHGDIRTLTSLPGNVDVVTAGFPCTDLSQAGRTAGISGNESGLVADVFRLLKGRNIEWLVLENVRNMLVLDGGKAMSYLTSELESLGFRWAYRLVDSRFAGVPQRRHRVLFVASRHNDPRGVLFADESGEPDSSLFNGDVYGFYWTEGLTGLGWAKDAVPPLKGGSAVGIPSPPGIWIRDAEPGRKLVTPSISDAEVLQGFGRGWTEPVSTGRKKGPRWKLVGNAVTVGVAEWLVGRLYKPGPVKVRGSRRIATNRWPNSAFGERGKVWQYNASTWPVRQPYQHLSDLLTNTELQPLSRRATAGFLERTNRAKLRFDADFLKDVREHLDIRIAVEVGSGSGRVLNRIASA